jgi:uncharacterized protein YjfI (DUF2170 family)
MRKIDRKVIPESDVVVTDLENKEAVILNLKTNLYYTLNEIGFRIWQMADNGFTVAEMSQKLYEEYEVTLEKAEENVANLIDDLSKEKLVKYYND